MQPTCFFDSTAEREHGDDRLLLLSYHFPPSTAAGALRWQRFARHVTERGWQLDVVALDPSALAISDPATLADLPAGVRAFGVEARGLPLDRAEDAAWRLLRSRCGPPATASQSAARPAPSRPSSLSTGQLGASGFGPAAWRRAYHAWRESVRQREWAHRAERGAAALLGAHRYRALVSCGPPHAVHIAARRLSDRFGVPFVMDLRDPWSLVERLPEAIASPLWLRLARREERRCIARTALVAMNTEPAAEAMARAYPEAASRILAVRNGVDTVASRSSARPERFVIAYAGSVYLDRDPTRLFCAVGRLAAAEHIGPDALGVEFMGDAGRIGGRSLEDVAAAAGIAPHFRHHPPGTRSAAQELLARASVLVNLPQDSHLAIPSKLYEYMQYDAALLVLAEPHSATARLLEGTDAAVVHPSDEDGIVRALEAQWRAWRRGERPQALGRDPRFSRAAQAARLLDALDRVALPAGRVGLARAPHPSAVSVAGP